MSAANVIIEARAAGIQLAVDGDDLLLQATLPPPPDVLSLLRTHKAEILAFLRLGPDGGAVQNWQAFFDERAGIAGFDGGQSRSEVEKRAFECCVIEWLNQHGEPSDPDSCVWCKQTDLPEHAIVPFGINQQGNAWLHPECWSDWQKHRRASAVHALQVNGIRAPHANPLEPKP